jgi:hypothetical protein
MTNFPRPAASCGRGFSFVRITPEAAEGGQGAGSATATGSPFRTLDQEILEKEESLLSSLLSHSPMPRVLMASLPSVENRTLEQKGIRSYTEPFDDHFVERALKTEKFIPGGYH